MPACQHDDQDSSFDVSLPEVAEEANPPVRIPVLPAIRSRPPSQCGPLTECDVAAICENHWLGQRLFAHDEGAWYIERNGLWMRDGQGETKHAARLICEDLGDPRFKSAQKISAIENIARYTPGIAVRSDAFDADPFLLSTPEGAVDLRNGKLLSPDAKYLLRKSTAIAPDSHSPIPLWREFLSQITDGDQETIDLIQRWAGYCLTGDTREQKFLFLYGEGRNGKGVLIQTLADILGDYAHCAQSETFACRRNQHPTDMAAMLGKRIVYVSETERGSRLDEARIKNVTGGDKIRAHFMRQDGFEYQPQFKLMISGNYEPQLRPDAAICNRMIVVPFKRKFIGKGADLHLKAKLKTEWPGILNWMIEGCLAWRQRGLAVPDTIRS